MLKNMVGSLKIWGSFLIFLVLVQPAWGADYAREKRWADEVVPGILVGEAIYLQQRNGHRFLGIHAEGDQKRTGLVIVHGMGIHPDWGMIGTLRQRLNDFGYTTLSIQMPILAKNASYHEYLAVFPEAVERLGIAVRHLKSQEYNRIVIISHSNGSRMSRRFMTSNPPDVNAWAALSLTQGDTFTDIQAPVLDLYGEHDLEHVLASVNARRASFMNSLSIQRKIASADHFFAGKEDEMVIAVKEFLKKLN
ncbi:MAG: alpha/beta hydrolase family protein [Gammaproteobacteria bacterium]|nr:alpha/beta hydrolase family protein [Gammaproteobacteria bacterium]